MLIQNLSYHDIYEAKEKNRSRKDANIKKWQGNVDHTVKHEKMLPIQQFT